MFRIISKLKNKRGFTLIELIVVLAVLAIIMAIAVPRFLGVQEEAKLSADESTAAMIGKAAELYLAKDGNKIADITTLAATDVADLEEELNITKIEFKSEDYEGKEGTIVITEAGSIVTVKVDGNTLYPKP